MKPTIFLLLFLLTTLATFASTLEKVKRDNKQDFGICVDWKVQENNSWVDTTADVKKTAGILQYKLFGNGGKYRLEFTNTVTYNYYFSDETGDRYQVNTYLTGNHYVEYSSSKPNIVFISGS
ncbi:unnamed protein product [Rhizophagus irregularis]|uniref:Uncharacterized protein n=1 Tax=Rhizophagus irregularis TaxID=588596 RepID=A0A916E5Z2_9GLOM|nr:unnamed protein product [Rhizophagus irregularis]